MTHKMPDIQFTAQSEKNLIGVHPDLVRVMRLALYYSLVPFSITEGLRSITQQRERLCEGRSQTLKSRHLSGHAVNVAAMPAGVVSWEWSYYAQIAVAVRRGNVISTSNGEIVRGRYKRVRISNCRSKTTQHKRLPTIIEPKWMVDAAVRGTVSTV